MSFVACPVLQYFPHYLIHGTIFRKKLPNIKCVFWPFLQLLSETFLILRRTEWRMLKIYVNLHIRTCYSCQILKKHDFQKKVTEYKMCVLTFSTTSVWNISHSKKNWVTYVKNICSSSYKDLLFLSDFNETWTFLTDLKKYSSIKCNENLSSESQVVPCGQTDRHDEAKSRFSQFCVCTKQHQSYSNYNA